MERGRKKTASGVFLFRKKNHNVALQERLYKLLVILFFF